MYRLDVGVGLSFSFILNSKLPFFPQHLFNVQSINKQVNSKKPVSLTNSSLRT